MSDHDRENRVVLQQVAASALEQFTVLHNSSSTVTRRANREAHPKAVLSTKQRQEEPSEGTPVSASPHTLSNSSPQVVTSSRCRVSRQRSTPVDLPPAASPNHFESAEACCVVKKSTSNRPANLCLARELSRSSSNGSQGVTTPCPDPSLSPDGRQLVASYPPGPEACRLQSYEGPSVCSRCRRSRNCCLCPPVSTGDPHQVLARRIAERLIAIGDNVDFDVESLTLSDFIETWTATLSLSHAGSNMTWRSLARLYGVLAELLTRNLGSNGQDLEGSELWQTFDKLWRVVLHTGVSWIADNGGWSAFIRETDYTAHGHFASSTPDCSRRGFTYSHPPLSADHTRYSTPQVSRRGLGHIQSSPTLRSARGNERGSRVLSLTQEGIFHLEGVCSEDPDADASEGEDDQRVNDEGIQFAATPSSSQSSFASDGYSSPVTHSNHTPLQSRPQSSTLLREGPLVTTEGSMFDRNRSMSFPTHRRPSSAGRAAGRRVHSSVMEDRELLAESLDSGLDASSQTSIASNDSALQYSTLGISAFCVYEAVKSMLDHK